MSDEPNVVQTEADDIDVIAQKIHKIRIEDNGEDQPATPDHDIKILTINVQHNGVHRGGAIPNDRRQYIREKIREKGPDIILMQECENLDVQLAEGLNYTVANRNNSEAVLVRNGIFNTPESGEELERLSYCKLTLVEGNTAFYIGSWHGPNNIGGDAEHNVIFRNMREHMDEVSREETTVDGESQVVQYPWIVGGDFNLPHYEITNANRSLLGFSTIPTNEEEGRALRQISIIYYIYNAAMIQERDVEVIRDIRRDGISFLNHQPLILTVRILNEMSE